MPKHLRSFATTVLAACLLVAGLPALATEPADDFIALPFNRYGDMLVDPAHGQVFVTGGGGYNEIAVVKLDGSGVTMIPNAPGATKMSMTQDGRYVYAALRNGDGIAEIDTASLSLRQLDTGAGSCPTDVAAVAGYVWYVASNTNDCDGGFRNIRRLDPATGEASANLVWQSFLSPKLRVVPGTTKLLSVDTATSRSNVDVYDVAGGTLSPAGSGSLDFPYIEVVELTSSGTHVMSSGRGSVNFFRLSDFTADGVSRLPDAGWPTAFTADEDVLAVARPYSTYVDVLRRSTDERLNSIELGPESDGNVKGLRLLGDRMFAVTLHDTLRFYQVDRPATPSPDLTIEAPSEVPVGDPVTVSGVLTDQGAPIPGATVTVRQDGLEQPLGSPTTGADGRYSFEFVPPEPGWVLLRVTYGGDGSVKPAVGRAAVAIVHRPVTLTLAGPESVWPDEPVSLSGTLFDDTEPVGSVSLDLARRCGSWQQFEPVDTVVTDPDGAFTARDMPGDCDSYQYQVSYDGDSVRDSETAYLTVKVAWVRPSLNLQAPPSAYVGDPVAVTGTLAEPGGPLVDKPVVVRVSTPSGWRSLGSVTTDSTGSFRTEDLPEVAGGHCYQATFEGDPRTRATTTERCVSVTKRTSSLSLSGPDTASLDEPVVLTGRLTTSDGAALASADLAVSRSDPFRGTEALPAVVTGPAGEFTVRDLPPNGGLVSYAVAYAGNASHAAVSTVTRVTVSRPAPTLTLTTDRASYDHGQTATVTVDLATDSLRKVYVYATESGRARTLIFYGDVPDSGVALPHLMTRNTTFSARIPEDGRALAAQTSLDRRTRASLIIRALGSYATSGNYKLYRPAVDPRFAAMLKPARDSACLAFQLQRRYSAGWRTVTTSKCLPVGDKSTSTWTLTGTQATKTPYRVRPKFGGDDMNAASNGSWVYFKVVRPS